MSKKYLVCKKGNYFPRQRKKSIKYQPQKDKKKKSISDQYNFLQTDTQTMPIQISAILEFGMCRKTQRYMCTYAPCPSGGGATPSTTGCGECDYETCLCTVLKVSLTPIFLYCRILYLTFSCCSWSLYMPPC